MQTYSPWWQHNYSILQQGRLNWLLCFLVWWFFLSEKTEKWSNGVPAAVKTTILCLFTWCMFLRDGAQQSCKTEVMNGLSTSCTGVEDFSGLRNYILLKRKLYLLVFIYYPCHIVQIHHRLFCELRIIKSVYESCICSIVIWIREQKWQISLKATEVDYPLISKAHALRAPHHPRSRFRGQECPAYPWSADLHPRRHHILLIKILVQPFLFLPLCDSSHCILSDWCWLGSPKSLWGIMAQCAGG